MPDPFVSLLSVLIFVGAIGLFVAFFRGWAAALRKWEEQGIEGVVQPHQGFVPWGLIDLIGLAVLLAIIQVLFSQIGARLWAFNPLTPLDKQSSTQQAAWLMVFASSNLAFVLVALLVLRYVRGATWRELGWTSAELVADVKLGWRTFCMVAPLVYGMQALLVRFWPSHHPLIEVVTKDPSPLLLALSGFTACVVAPLFEEVAFRLFFQGWLQNAVLAFIRRGAPGLEQPGSTLFFGPAPHLRAPLRQGTLFEASSEASPMADEVGGPERERPAQPPWTAALNEPPIMAEVVELATTSGEPTQPVDVREWHRETARRAGPGIMFLPIVVSAITFALLHFSHGPDWIPLTFLAIALGYLYHRTQRIVPCIVVHMALNSVSFLMLLIGILSGQFDA